MKLPRPAPPPDEAGRRAPRNSALDGEADDEPPALVRAHTCPQRALDLLSDEQLTKLTKSNTRKNLGGRKSRFRSQMERVCRRLDNLAGDVRLYQKQQMRALPVVRPDGASRPRRASAVDALVTTEDRGAARRRTGPPSQSGVGLTSGKQPGRENEAYLESLENALDSDDCFAIEPATQHDTLFSNGSASMKSGTSSCAPKSVRISASVTVLDYEHVDHPISVSTLERLEHPTRRDRSVLNRRAIAQEGAFKNATILISEKVDVVDSDEDENENGRDETKIKNVGKGLSETSPRNSPTAPPSGQKTPTRAKTKATAAFAAPTPGGPYGPRSLPK